MLRLAVKRQDNTMNPNTTKFLTTTIERSGGLPAVTKVLAEAGISVDVLWSNDEQVFFLPTDVSAANVALNDAGLTAEIVDFVGVESPAGAGNLHAVLERLAEAGIALDACILTATQLYIGCDQVNVAMEALENVVVTAA